MSNYSVTLSYPVTLVSLSDPNNINMTTIVIANPELNAALKRIGFSDAVAVDTIDSQGIDSLEELKVLED